jgi:chromosome partitioning protein
MRLGCMTTEGLSVDISSRQFMKRFGGLLSQALKNLAIAQNPPDAHREMRKFSATEVAALLGVTDAYIRQMLIKEPSISADVSSLNGRRQFSLEQVLELRMMLAENGRKKWMNPRRLGEEKCQILAVTNFKGGSSKTSTTIHLGHYLAL